jgi:aldehyde dehydrogenase (NAD+)
MRGNLIGGEWVGSASGRTRQRYNPADDRELVSSAPESDATDADQAVTAVAAGYRRWADRTAEARADVLNATADILADRADSIARELVREEGKTLAEALNETRRTPANFRFYAGEALRLGGHTFASGDRNLVYTSREPVGVVVAITPWNFPLNIPSRKLGPALAAGNAVVFKPSEVTPLLGQRMVEALLDAGLPAGAIAMVHGGSEVGSALVSDKRVAAVTFTGSTAVGAQIYRGMDPARRCQLEMGGKNPVLVLDDADLDVAADVVARGAFGLTGQACTGTSRVVVHESVHDALVERIVDIARSKRIGNGLKPGVDCGPLATDAQLVKMRDHIDAAKSAGARMVAGDEPLEPGLEHGHFVRPAVFTDVDPASRLAQEEVFGPVLAVIRVASFEDAVEVANNTEYGLSAGIVTRDIERALTFARRSASGIVKINQPTTGVAPNAPFGGIKNSSTQTFKEQAGDTMMRFYTTDKTVYLGS